jgi:hypothetical protein
MNDLEFVLIVFLAIFGTFLILFIGYYIYRVLKGILLGFSSRKDYLLFRDFKNTIMKDTSISLELKKSIVKRAKNRLNI